MKTYVIGLLLMGFTNLMIAQNDLAVLSASNHSEYNKSGTSINNSTYLSAMKNLDMSKKILKLQGLVAQYNIMDHQVYNPKSPTTYTVTFLEGENTIKAIYDKNGKLLKCQEQYQSIKLPYTLSSELIKNYPGWALNEVYCDIQYRKDYETHINYRVELKKGKKTKTVSLTI